MIMNEEKNNNVLKNDNSIYTIEEQKSMFQELYKIDVTGLIEKKPGAQGKTFDYLPWADAWAIAKTYDPFASFRIKEFKGADGNPLHFRFYPGMGYMVFTEVTLRGITQEMYLPILDKSNNPVKNMPYTTNGKYPKEIQACDIMNLNNTIQRCLVKNLALFGLGLKVYQGKVDLEDEFIVLNNNNNYQQDQYNQNYDQTCNQSYDQPCDYDQSYDQNYSQDSYDQGYAQYDYNYDQPEPKPSEKQLDFLKQLYTEAELKAICISQGKDSIADFSKKDVSSLISNRSNR